VFRRVTKAAIAVLVVVVLAVACSSDGFPTGYSDQPDPVTNIPLVQTNWMNGCQVSLEEELASDANQVCECSYEWLSGPDGIPFEEFVELNNDLKSDPLRLQQPEKLTANDNRLLEVVKGCIARG